MTTWKLKSLKIDFREYGELKGKYVGTIQFENGEQEAFTCNLTPERCAEYLNLVQKEVMANACDLKDKLHESLKEITGFSSQPILQLTVKDNP